MGHCADKKAPQNAASVVAKDCARKVIFLDIGFRIDHPVEPPAAPRFYGPSNQGYGALTQVGPALQPIDVGDDLLL
jgi:hypothetical protein